MKRSTRLRTGQRTGPALALALAMALALALPAPASAQAQPAATGYTEAIADVRVNGLSYGPWLIFIDASLEPAFSTAALRSILDGIVRPEILAALAGDGGFIRLSDRSRWNAPLAHCGRDWLWQVGLHQCRYRLAAIHAHTRDYSIEYRLSGDSTVLPFPDSASLRNTRA